MVYNILMNKMELENRQLNITSLLFSYLVEGFKESNTKIEIIKKSFLLLLEDFLDEKLKIKPDLYTLETFAGHMLFVVDTPDEIKKNDQKLSDALDIASDITYYYNEGKKTKNFDKYEKLVQNLKNYFESEKKR